MNTVFRVTLASALLVVTLYPIGGRAQAPVSTKQECDALVQHDPALDPNQDPLRACLVKYDHQYFTVRPTEGRVRADFVDPLFPLKPDS